MSFSSEVKDEIAKIYPQARHCKIAEIAAIISLCGVITRTKGTSYNAFLVTDNDQVTDLYEKLIKDVFGDTQERAQNILKTTKLMDQSGNVTKDMLPTDSMIVKDTCCKRAYLRGAFLCSGSISNPEKFYHLEIVCDNERQAEFIRNIICSFELDAHIVTRKKYFVVYLKEGEQIVDFLNIIEAHQSLMEFENVRIIKDVRNSINRMVNCEAANINRTVAASVKQVEDIKYIRDTVGLDSLSPNLREIAEVRLENEGVPLKELGELLEPPVGKSGVNHRLRKLGEIAEDIRRNNGLLPREEK